METTSAERNRPKATAPFQCGDHRLPAVDGLQVGKLLQVPGEAGHPSGRRPLDEGVGHRAEGTEGLLGLRLRPDRALRRWSRTSIVIVVDGGLTRGNDQMLGDDLAQEHHLDDAVLDPELDAAADVVVGH